MDRDVSSNDNGGGHGSGDGDGDGGGDGDQKPLHVSIMSHFNFKFFVKQPYRLSVFCIDSCCASIAEDMQLQMK